MEIFKKAFRCSAPWTYNTLLVYAETASQARYQCKDRLMNDCIVRLSSSSRPGPLNGEWFYDETYSWLDIKVRRDKGNDLMQPVPMEICNSLTKEQIHIVAHSNGNDSTTPGFRNHYCCSADNPDLLQLVELKIMNGPYNNGLMGGGEACFILSPMGTKVAMSLLPKMRKIMEFA